VLIRLAIAGGLLWVVLREVDLAGFGRALRSAAPGWLLVAVLLVLVDRTLTAVRWLMLLRAIEPGLARPLSRILRIFFVSTFAGTAVPGGIGGDALRVIGLARLGVPTRDAIGSAAVDRLMGTMSVFVTAVIGLLLAGRLVDSRLLTAALALMVGGGIIALLLLFDSRVLSGIIQFAGGHRWPRLQRLAQKFLTAVRQYGQHRGLLATLLVISVVVQLLRALQAWCLGLALGLGIGGFWYLAFIPIIVMVMQVPISIAGLGTSNYVFVELFALAGVAADPAFALSMLFLGLGLVGNLPGGLLVLFEPSHSSADAVTHES
jgi:uncharacterized protein (TIRG00374 family)